MTGGEHGQDSAGFGNCAWCGDSLTERDMLHGDLCDGCRGEQGFERVLDGAFTESSSPDREGVNRGA